MKAFVTKKIFIPKTYDIDFAGIVSNQVYIRWLEDLRYKMMEDYYSWDKLLNGKAIPVLIKTEIKYKKSVNLLDKVNGIMWISKIKGPKFYLQAEFKVIENLAVEASQIGAFINKNNFKPMRIPDDMKTSIEKKNE